MLSFADDVKNSEARSARSFEVTLRQIREENQMVYYQASANGLARAANAYGHSPEAALAKLYEEVIPGILGNPVCSEPASLAPVIPARNPRGMGRLFRKG